MIKIGCCGFPGGIKNYMKNFSLVEVQRTFYKPPRPKTVRKWREMAGDDFEFVVKAWQVITHPPSSPTYRKAGIDIDGDAGFFKPCRNVEMAWKKTEEIARILKSRVILFQTPGSFKENDDNMENMRSFFSDVDRDFLFAWEPRGWNREKVRAICEELGLIHACDPFVQLPVMDGDITYFRLHGSPPGERMYMYEYTDADLRYVSDTLKKFENDVYCLFNNVTMFRDALRLRRILEGGE